MQDLPHLYRVSASVEGGANVTLSAASVVDIESASPPEFGGPGDVWSPEGLLVAAVGDCFILSFRAIARTAKLDWISLDCETEGTLDKIEKLTQFTAFTVKAQLTVPPGTNEKKARTILEKAEKYCLITNSMKADSHLEAEVVVAD
jgi:organic hydroperoxide reductase OsmC/OhrA